MVLGLKMHGNNLRPNPPLFSLLCPEWQEFADLQPRGVAEKTAHRSFPAPYSTDKVSFKKLTGLGVTPRRQRSPGTSPDKTKHEH